MSRVFDWKKFVHPCITINNTNENSNDSREENLKEGGGGN